MDRKKVRRRSLEKPHGEESSTLKNSQKDVEYCGMWNLPFLDRGGWRLSGARAGLETFQRSNGAGWLEGRREALACALPTRPVLVFYVFLVKKSRAVSEATTVVGRRARVRRCVQNSEEFSSEKIFPNFSAHPDFRRTRH